MHKRCSGPLNKNNTPPFVSFLSLTLFLAAFEDDEDKRPRLDMRVRWLGRRGGGGVVVSGMCVNCAPPPINHGDKLKEKKEEEEEEKQADGGEKVGAVGGKGQE